MIDVRWLFQNHKAHLARIKLLEYLLDKLQNIAALDNYLIETLIYQSGVPNSLRHSPFRRSRTEYIALNMDDERQRAQSEISAIRTEWEHELIQLSLYVNLFEAVRDALTEEEYALAHFHYIDHYTIEEISQMPLTNRASGVKSKSTLKRILRTIESKGESIMSVVS